MNNRCIFPGDVSLDELEVLVDEQERRFLEREKESRELLSRKHTFNEVDQQYSAVLEENMWRCNLSLRTFDFEDIRAHQLYEKLHKQDDASETLTKSLHDEFYRLLNRRTRTLQSVTIISSASVIMGLLAEFGAFGSALTPTEAWGLGFGAGGVVGGIRQRKDFYETGRALCSKVTTLVRRTPKRRNDFEKPGP